MELATPTSCCRVRSPEIMICERSLNVRSVGPWPWYRPTHVLARALLRYPRSGWRPAQARSKGPRVLSGGRGRRARGSCSGSNEEEAEYELRRTPQSRQRRRHQVADGRPARAARGTRADQRAHLPAERQRGVRRRRRRGTGGGPRHGHRGAHRARPGPARGGARPAGRDDGRHRRGQPLPRRRGRGGRRDGADEQDPARDLAVRSARRGRLRRGVGRGLLRGVQGRVRASSSCRPKTAKRRRS